MLMSVDKLRNYIDTEKSNQELEDHLLALESDIRNHTHNNFQTNIRFVSNTKEIKTPIPEWLKIGDTLQVSNSLINNGLYTIKSITGEIIGLNEPIYSEPNALFIKIQYPADVVMGAIEILRWKFKNEDRNYNPNAEKEIQSETISRHSVTYAKDNTEEQIDARFGVPTKYTSFLRKYMKARF